MSPINLRRYLEDFDFYRLRTLLLDIDAKVAHLEVTYQQLTGDLEEDKGRDPEEIRDLQNFYHGVGFAACQKYLSSATRQMKITRSDAPVFNAAFAAD